MKKITGKLREKFTIYLSHRPGLYALIVGIGVVWFWRGVWHSTDLINAYLNIYQNHLSLDSISNPWWDGLISLIFGFIVLYFSGAFTSSFIGNELILSGLRGEKRLNQKTETEIKGEEEFISDIKQELKTMTVKIEELEKEIYQKVSKN